jgi:hypothetical protein
MEQLPYIDEHSINIGAAPGHAWSALVATLRTDLGGTAPVPVTRALGVEPAQRRGDWRGTVHVGDTLPGFAVAEIRAPRYLALEGHHRFSRYELAFELTGEGNNCTLLARTRALFPGLTGRAYRALVIGTGAHRLIVRRLLRNVARRS